MLKISELLKQHNISKDEFKKAYKEVMWKEMSCRTYTISESNFDKIKNKLNLNKKKSDTKNVSKKVLKGSELNKAWGFFSGLWFWSTTSTKKKNNEETEKTKEENITKNKETKKEWKKEDFFAQVSDIAKQRWTFNARVIKRVEDSKSDKKNKKFEKKWKFNRSNIKFEKKEYKAHKKHEKTNENKKQIRDTKQIKSWHKKTKEIKVSQTLKKKSEIKIWDTITVKELSEKMWVNITEIMKIMLQNKILWWINTALDFDTAALIASEFDVEVKHEEQFIDIDKMLEWDLQAILDLDKEADTLLPRAPIVTVMWHVDHWKTSLLDYIRKSNIAWWEAWWITQSIWASKIKYNDKEICFIDTPWHELFTNLRARGAKLTNIVVIVIAAEDWIMPQTEESINHAKEAWVPIIIAVTKIDKIENKQKQQLAIENIKSAIWKFWLIPEDWWWDVPVIWVSSKTWQWVNELLENILLQAEMLDLKYNPNRKAVWVIVDAYKDPKQWITASCIVLTWTLKTWDIVVAYNTYWKVRRMLDFTKKPIKKAQWWDPILILWFHNVPEPGRILEVVDKEKQAQQKIEQIKQQITNENSQSTLQKFLEQRQDQDISILKVILKSDWPSWLEALKQAVNQIPCPENVKIKIIHSSIWIITDADISLAQASDAIILGFNTSIPSLIQKKADEYKVTVKNYNIIYELLEDLTDILEWMVQVELQEVMIWKLEVLWIFYKKEKTMIIWWKVIEWKIKNQAKFKLIRNDEEIWRWEITSLQREQESVSEVSVWHECWLKVKTNKKIQLWDILEVFVLE